MRDDGKYCYWKLREDYFEGETMVLLESAQEGALYENILLKLCLKSLRHNGELRLEDGTPCTPQSLAVVTRQQVGTVERALKLFHRLGFADPLPDGTWYMTPVENMIGRSSIEGDRKRRARNARRNAPDQGKETDGGEAGQSGYQTDRPCSQTDKQSGSGAMERTVQQEQEGGQMSAQKSAHMSRLPDKCPDTCPQGAMNAQMPAPDIAARPVCPPPWGDCPPMWGDRLVLGQFRNVFLTRKELSDLRDAFPGLADAYVEQMSRYMHSSGRTYENHADTLRQWIVKDTVKAPRTAGPARSARNALPGYDHDYSVEEGETI